MEIGEILLYASGGGALVKLIEFLLKRYLDRRVFNETLSSDERVNLRKDIEYLRGQIGDMRRELEQLKGRLTARDEEVSVWQRKYWGKKIILDKIVLLVENGSDENLKNDVHRIAEGGD